MKAQVIMIWNYLFNDTEKIEQCDSIKLAKELIFKGRTPQEIILIYSGIGKEVKEHLLKVEAENEKQNKAIDLYFNPIVNSFKGRAKEIKENYNYSFENINSKQEYAECLFFI